MVKKIGNLFASRAGIILSAAVIGIVAVVLQKLGNPANMGVCVACFTRDIAGALGLHRAAPVQYLRPEIPGIIIGALLSSFLFGEFKPRAGSMPIVRFLLGVFAMIGALVFLGCPWRTMLRIAGGDLNAIVGLAGLIAGIFVGTRFFVMGFDPGASRATSRTAGLVLPLLAIGAVILLVVFQPVAGQPKNGLLFTSVKGPGAAHANVFISLGAGLLIGLLLQRSRFCTIGGFRDLILFRQFHLVSGVIAMIAAALMMNLALGQFKPGMEGQPGAHTMWLWNFLGMVLAGLAFTLGGGCPGRQCVLAGEGDSDSAMFVLGMLVGAAFAHNFDLNATGKGVLFNGQAAVVLGLVVCCGIGLSVRRKAAG